MPTSPESSKAGGSFGYLRVGDVIEAREMKGSHLYRGEIDDIAYKQGILWILHGQLRSRKLIDSSRYDLSKCPILAPEDAQGTAKS